MNKMIYNFTMRTINKKRSMDNRIYNTAWPMSLSNVLAKVRSYHISIAVFNYQAYIEAILQTVKNCHLKKQQTKP